MTTAAVRPEVASPPGAPPPRRPSGALRSARTAWRTLTSMRTALLLLLALAVAAVPGSVLPQRPVSPAAVAQHLADRPVLGPVLDRLGLYDVFGAPWFLAVYLLLMISLVGCIVPRVRAHAAAVRRRRPRRPRTWTGCPPARARPRRCRRSRWRRPPRCGCAVVGGG